MAKVSRVRKMGSKRTFGLLVITAILALFYALGVFLLDVGAYLQSSMLHATGNALLIARIWQLAGIPMLAYFLVRRFPPKFLPVPIMLIAPLAWVLVEARFGFPLGPFSPLRDGSMMLIGLATTVYSLFLAKAQLRSLLGSSE